MLHLPENNSNVPAQTEVPGNNQGEGNLNLSDLSFLSFFMSPEAAQKIFTPELVESNDAGTQPPSNSL